MNNIENLIKKNNKLTLLKSVRLIKNNENKYIVKRKNNNIKDIYNYLNSRSFDYYPKLISEDNNYNMFEYIEDYKEPYEQKTLDMMSLLSLLHSKTTFYKEIDYEDYKYIYESTINLINDNYNYYNIMLENIENQIYMSPSSYLLARNITKIFNSLNYCRSNIDKWYEMVKDKNKVRMVLIHNNLELDHYIKKDKPYFLSWDKSKIDMPIIDLYVFYRKHYLNFDFYELFKYYESRYPLLEEERLLLFIYLSIPDKIELDSNEYNLCKKIRRFLDYHYKTEKLITEYNIKDTT